MSPPDDLGALAAPPCPILTAPEDIAPYARDWTGRYAQAPRAVLRPGSTAEVAAALRACAAEGLAVVPAGGRTGLCGGAVPGAGNPQAVVLSLERMNRIRDVDARDFSITVDAGCTVASVQAAAASVERLFPLSFGAEGTAQIGGALSTNAGGIRTLRWGNTRDLVLGLEVVLPDGRVLNDLRRVRKDNTGYALRHLFIGGEGTLGVITGAALKLAPALRARETAMLAVPSPEAALALLDRLVSNGAALIGFELIGRWPLELVRRHGARARLPFALESPWYVLLELGTAEAGADLRPSLEAAMAAAIEAGEAGETVIAESEEQRAALWYLREVMPECNRAEAPSVSADTSVPVSAVPSFLSEVEAAFAERWPEGKLIAVGHAGDGNVHISLQAPRGTPREAWHAQAEAIEDTVNRIAVAHGGSFSAEHGIGQSKRHAMAALRDPVALDLMRAIKAAIDPRGMMNPGKMLPG